MTTRRRFLAAGAAVGSLAAMGSSGVLLAEESKMDKTNKEMPLPKRIEPGMHKLPDLGYGYDALEPYIDAETLKTHHDKHHQGYVNGLNAAEKAFLTVDKDDYADIAKLESALAFHLSGHINHTLYWAAMRPHDKAKHEPGGMLKKMIVRDFGSVDKFKAQFSKASKTAEGNGWGALIYHPDYKRLYTVSLLNHQNAMAVGGVPLLVCDVWEHAYYLKYKNMRGDYIKNWWNVVCWGAVEKRFAKLLALSF